MISRYWFIVIEQDELLDYETSLEYTLQSYCVFDCLMLMLS